MVRFLKHLFWLQSFVRTRAQPLKTILLCHWNAIEGILIFFDTIKWDTVMIITKKNNLDIYKNSNNGSYLFPLSGLVLNGYCSGVPNNQFWWSKKYRSAFTQFVNDFCHYKTNNKYLTISYDSDLYVQNDTVIAYRAFLFFRSAFWKRVSLML